MVACPILVQSSQAARAMWPSQVARLGLSDFDSSNVACPISVSLQPRWPVQTPNPLAGPAILPVQSWPAILAGNLGLSIFGLFGSARWLPVQFCLHPILPSNVACPISVCPISVSLAGPAILPVQFWLSNFGLSGGLSCPVACPNSFVTKLLRMPVAIGLVLAWRLSNLAWRLSNLDGPIWMLLGLAPVQTGFTNWNHGQTGSPTGFFQCFAADGAGPLGKSPGFG